MLFRSVALAPGVAKGHDRNGVVPRGKARATSKPIRPKAPITYISVYNDPDFSVGVFVVGGGQRIPLHNHPRMFGLLKVVAGDVDIECYSKVIKYPREGRQSLNALVLGVRRRSRSLRGLRYAALPRPGAWPTRDASGRLCVGRLRRVDADAAQPARDPELRGDVGRLPRRSGAALQQEGGPRRRREARLLLLPARRVGCTRQ